MGERKERMESSRRERKRDVIRGRKGGEGKRIKMKEMRIRK